MLQDILCKELITTTRRRIKSELECIGAFLEIDINFMMVKHVGGFKYVLSIEQYRAKGVQAFQNQPDPASWILKHCLVDPIAFHDPLDLLLCQADVWIRNGFGLQQRHM